MYSYIHAAYSYTLNILLRSDTINFIHNACSFSSPFKQISGQPPHAPSFNDERLIFVFDLNPGNVATLFFSGCFRSAVSLT